METSDQESGPFITVVSVDGGCHYGNKLTVITPSEISENCRDGLPFKPSSSPYGNENCQLEEELNYNDEGCAAYVTVLALGKQKENGPSVGEKKSIVNIFNENEDLGEFLPYPDEEDFEPEPELSEPEPIRVLRRQRSIVSIEEKAPEISEQVIVYRLPGERLGFGLRFEGGVTNPSENVRRLFIQSCADDSPAWRTRTSWGPLVEGDEILEIHRVPVSSMTRMDCVQSMKDCAVAVDLLVRHFYSSTEIQLITKAKLEVPNPHENMKSNPSTPEPFLEELQEEEVQQYEEEPIKKRKSSRRRIPSSSHSLSAESAYGSCSYTNSELRVSSSLSDLSNSPSSPDDTYYDRKEESAYENNGDEDELTITKHMLLLEVDNQRERDDGLKESYYKSGEEQLPQVPPRKSTLMTREIQNSIESITGGQQTLANGSEDLNLQLKPPAGFDDSLGSGGSSEWDNGLGASFPDSVLDIMNMSSDLIMEAERIRLALNNETAALLSTSNDGDGDRDGTASTRSTVISRLSMASTSALDSINCTSNTNQNQNFRSGRVVMNGGPQATAKLRSGPEQHNNKSLIPLEPPLSFQDGGGEDAPFQMPVRSTSRSTSVNIIHSNGEQRMYDDDYEEDDRCLTSNSISDGMWSPYPNPEEDELALFAQELGQENDHDEVGKELGLWKPQANEDSSEEVMIRIEWLHEIEEQVQTLEPDVFPLVNVVELDDNITNEVRLKEPPGRTDHDQIFEEDKIRQLIPINPNQICGITPSDIDKYSRVVFPVCFVCFNLLYWIIYLHISNVYTPDLVLLATKEE